MRICFLSWRDGLHPEAGGSEVFLEQICQRLAARGHEITIVTSADRRPDSRDGTGIRRIRRGNRLTVFPWGWWHVLTHRRHHDVVVEVMNGLSFASRLARPRASVIVFHHSHQRQWTMIYPDWRGRLGRRLEAGLVTLLNRGARWITVSDSSRQDLERWHVSRGHISVIPNASDHVIGGVGQTVPGRLVCTARLVPHKQVEHAIDVVAAMKDRHRDIHLEIVGDGYWADELRRHAAGRQVADRVHFHGHVSDEERNAVVGSAVLNLLPSTREGWGLVISEAAQWSVPSVAYRHAGGVVEAIEDGRTGRVVDDLTELIAAVDMALSDPDATRAWGRKAQEMASSRTWEDATSEFEAVLQLLEP